MKYPTITEYPTNRTIRVNESLQESATFEDGKLLEISRTTYITYQELLRRFLVSNWKPITITMKLTQETLTITPVSQNYPTPNELSQVEYWLVDGSILPYLSSESLITIAIRLVDYKDLLETSNKSKQNLQSYYERHIKGHSQEEYQKGCTFLDEAHKLFEKRNLSKIKNFWQWVTTEFPNYIEQTHRGTTSEVTSALELVDAISTYSDSYKELYGHRPCFPTTQTL